MKKLWFPIVLIGLISAGTVAALFHWKSPEVTAPIRGKTIADNLGCFACHGSGGIGSIADPLAPDGRVPDWSAASAEQYIRNREDIREWIQDGKLHDEASLEDESLEDPFKTERLVPMPAYRAHLSDSELDDLVAYFEAVSGWEEEIPDAAFEGRKIAEEMGCFGCHGPSGIGAVPNPGSFKGYVPAWDGEDFGELVRDDDELREWILDGHVARLWNNPLARYYLERQTMPMPAYRNYLSEKEVDELVAYIGWLRNR